MGLDVATTFTGLRFPNPFLLASAPPTESESNILHAFEAGWGGVVTKTIGMMSAGSFRWCRQPSTRTARSTSSARCAASIS